MSDLNYSEIIEKILCGKNNSKIKEYENILYKIKEENPNEFIKNLVILLKSSKKREIRSFSAIQLRKNLSSYSENNFKNLWNYLSSDCQVFVKSSLFNAIDIENDKFVLNQICDSIG